MDVGSREWFDAYLAAFNARDYESVATYYHPDVDFQGQAATLRGRQSIIDFYRGIHEQVTEGGVSPMRTGLHLTH